MRIKVPEALVAAAAVLLACLVTAHAQEAPRAPMVPGHPPELIREHMAEPPRESGHEPGPFGQEPLPEELGVLLDMALDRNPDIAVARVEVERAEVELRRARHEAAAEVTQVFAELQHARTVARQKMTLFDKGRGPHDDASEAKAAVAELETRLRYLTGMMLPERHGEERWEGERGFAMGLEGEWMPAPRPDDVPRKLREVLESPVSMDYDDESVELGDIMGFLAEMFSVNMLADLEVCSLPVRAKLEDSPLREALEAIAAQHEPVCFVMQDWGIFATTRERAMRMNAATIPADVPMLVRPEGRLAADIERPPRGEMIATARPTQVPEELREVLNTRVSLDFDGAQALRDIVTFLQDLTQISGAVVDPQVAMVQVTNFRVEGVSLKDTLLALTDQQEGLCFVLRDSVVLATTKARAQYIEAPTIPADVPLFVPRTQVKAVRKELPPPPPGVPGQKP